ncbi:universal stress protein [Massilia sp. BSC265]|uniref:universal stress protein n=1 Tax=Massilia sp. BSC265 TaxID=1549812 RepID=UPI0004E8C8EF|nr:universal stress protein [Massilia sp. BSC265]KFI07646.1 hypothetical protein JN27_08720 [Massilia sp. BSC265]
MKKILVPCDGSDSALRAVRHAAAEAQSHSTPARLELLHVIEPEAAAKFVEQHPLAASQTAASPDTPSPPAVTQALHAATGILEQTGVAYDLHWRAGHPAPEIAAHAQEHGCEEVIMGTRGRGALASLVMGSIATQVVRLVDIPVTLVR